MAEVTLTENIDLDDVEKDEKDEKREEQIKELVNALSQCSEILDLAPEMVIQLLKVKRQDFWQLQNALGIAQESKLEFMPDEMKEVLDMARVARVMEEDDARPIFTGMTGPTGYTGASGFLPINRPSGPPTQNMKQLKSSRGR